MDRITTLPKKRPYKILFAEYFNINNVYSVIAFSLKNNVNINIVILTKDTIIAKQLKDTIALCSSSALAYTAIKVSSIIDYYNSNKNDVNTIDYIEYNGGISRNTNDDVTVHLSIFKKLLVSDGVIGISFFVTNVHSQALQSMIDNMSSSNLFDASKARELMVRYYLESSNLFIYANDKELVSFLSNNSSSNSILRRQSDVTDIVKANGYSIQSWIPTVYSKPFDELQDYKHYQYQAFGISQETFVQEMLISFRNTLYVTKSNETFIPGRASFTSSHNTPINDAHNVIVLDRFSGMKEIGKVAAIRAAKGFSTEVTFTCSSLEKVNVSTVLMPVAAVAISKIGQNNSILSDIIDSSSDNSSSDSSSDDANRQHIIATLSYLESMNYITIIRKF